MNIVRLNNVGMNYVTGDGVKNINFELEQGEFLFLVGPSGAGKSTVLKLIYFEEMPFVGEVEVGQISSKSHKRSEIAYLRRQLGIVFQDFRLLEDRNVFENIAFVLRVTGMRRQDIKKRVLRVLTDVGISQLRGHEFLYRDGVVIPTYHPSAVLRQGGLALAQARADFVLAKAALNRSHADRAVDHAGPSQGRD